MYADAHCDTITRLTDNGQSLFRNDGQLDLERLMARGCVLQFFAIWIDPKYVPCCGLDRTIQAIDCFRRQIAANDSRLHPITTANDVVLAHAKGKIGALLSIEDGSALNGSIAALRVLHALGVRAMTLTWNDRNLLADGVGEGEKAGGLSTFGRQVVEEMNRLGMIVDVSHLSQKGFWDVAELCRQPFIASHSNAKAVCPHPRNLDDAQIRCLIRQNGYMGLNFYKDFLGRGNVTVDDIALHVEHVMALGGQHILGFGSDFDGADHLPQGMEGAQHMGMVINRLAQLGYSQKQLDAICYKNLQNTVVRILKKQRDKH